MLKFSPFFSRPTLFLETLKQHFVQIVVGDDSDVYASTLSGKKFTAPPLVLPNFNSFTLASFNEVI